MVRSILVAFIGTVLSCLTGCTGSPPRAKEADITLIGVATLPGESKDLSGLTGKLSDGTPRDRLGGLSGIASTGGGDEYVQLADRGPKDGATEYPCRFHRMTIRVRPGAATPVEVILTATALLTHESGQPFTGSLAALETRLDPEGVRVGRTGTLFTSDEYGPFVDEFDRAGKRLRRLALPGRFAASKPARNPADELPPKNTRGRVPNRGMEGLAITPDGTKLVGVLQSPLLQDGALDRDNNRVGMNCRLVEIDVVSGMTREYVYPLDHPANGVSEILAIDAHQFLVLERDSKGGREARAKRITLIDLREATDVSGIDSLPAVELPTTIRPVQKRPFLDLLHPRFGIAGAECPEKFEGLAFGPDLDDGRRLLLVTSDNDFIAEQPMRVYAFAIGRDELPGFEPHRFEAR